MMILPLNVMQIEYNIRKHTGCIIGLDLSTDRKFKKLSKRCGFMHYRHAKLPTLRQLSRQKPYSGKTGVPLIGGLSIGEPVKPTMTGIMRVKSVLDDYYFFGEQLSRHISQIHRSLEKLDTYRTMRKAVGLPCRGQRTKTNAQTCKKHMLKGIALPDDKALNYSAKKSLATALSNRRQKYLKLLSAHYTKEMAQYAIVLKKQKMAIRKARIIHELQGMRRYRHKTGQNAVEHYEEIYTSLTNRKR